MSAIKQDLNRRRVTQQSLVLGQVQLKNENDFGGFERVDTVISYKYNYSQYWGHGHGLLTGLPINYRLQNGTVLHGRYGIQSPMNKVEVSNIEAFLEPGTAVNVTLTGNYGEWDVPYTAIITALYKDGEKREWQIKDSHREYAMRDVLPEFGRVFFLHNNSYVPTTTTTTTTTTTSKTTTSKATTTTTEEAAPITPPEVVEDPFNSKEKKTVEEVPTDGKHENNIMIADDAAMSLKNKDAKGNDDSSSTALISSIVLIAVSVFSTLKVT